MRLHLTLGNSLSALRLGVSHGAGCVLGAAPGGHRLTALPRCGMTADMRRAGSTSALREIRVAALFPTAVRRVFVVVIHETEALRSRRADGAADIFWSSCDFECLTTAVNRQNV